MTGDGVVRGTMILATLAWSAGEVLMRRSPRADRIARAAWTLGVTLSLLHVAAAFELVYAWDHEAAARATLRQVEARFGLGWAGAIYVNYVFLAVWAADVAWWWIAPQSHSARSRRLESIRWVFFTVMFLNGAVVFATFPGRVLGAVAVAAAILASPVTRRRAVAA